MQSSIHSQAEHNISYGANKMNEEIKTTLDKFPNYSARASALYSVSRRQDQITLQNVPLAEIRCRHTNPDQISLSHDNSGGHIHPLFVITLHHASIAEHSTISSPACPPISTGFIEMNVEVK